MKLLALAFAVMPGVASGFVHDDPDSFLGSSTRPANGVYASLSYFTGNDWTSIRDFSGNWSRRYTPREGRNLAVAFLRAETGAAYGSWRIGYVHRREAIIDASRDTVDLLYLQNNNLPIAAGRRFDLELDAQLIEADGIKVDKGFEFRLADASSLRLNVAVSALRGSRTRSAAVRGSLAATVPGTYAFDVNWNDVYSDKTYPFITPGSAAGSGHSIDAALEYEWGRGNRLSLSVLDLDSRIAWRDVPSTDARAISATATRDAQGFVVYLPAVAGQNGRKEYIQHLDPKTTLRYSRTAGAFSVAAGAFVVRGIAIPQASVEYRFGEAWRVSLGREFRFGSFNMALRYKSLSLAVSAESRDPERARSLGLAAQLAWPL